MQLEVLLDPPSRLPVDEIGEGGGFLSLLVALLFLFSLDEVPITLFMLAMKPCQPKDPLLELDEASIIALLQLLQH